MFFINIKGCKVRLKKSILLSIICVFSILNLSASDKGEFIIKIPQDVYEENLGPDKIFIHYLDSSKLFCITDETNIFIVDANKKKVIRKLRYHSSAIQGLDVSNSSIISFDKDNEIVKWNINSTKPDAIYNFNDKLSIESISLDPNDNAFIVGLKKGFIDGNFNLKLNQNEFKMGLKAHTDDVYSVDFNNDGKYILSASKSGKIKLWSFKGLKNIREFDFYPYDSLPVLFSPVDNVFASSQSKNKIFIQNINGLVQSIINLKRNIKKMKFSKDGKYLLVLNDSNEIQVFETSTGDFEAFFSSVITQNNIVDFDISGSNNDIILVYDTGAVYRLRWNSMLVPIESSLNKDLQNKFLESEGKKTDSEKIIKSEKQTALASNDVVDESEIKVKKQETRNKKQETRNKKQETRNKKQETRNKWRQA